jgi:putative DNA primase/helicase
MFILSGSGANGKNTFLNTIMYVLGDYAVAASTE